MMWSMAECRDSLTQLQIGGPAEGGGDGVAECDKGSPASWALRQEATAVAAMGGEKRLPGNPGAPVLS